MINCVEALGVIVLFMNYPAALPAIFDMLKRKSTDGFQWSSSVMSLFTTTFVLYYAILKANGHVLDVILISINAFGVLVQASYAIIFTFLSPTRCQVYKICQLIFMAVVSAVIIGLTISQIHDVHARRKFVGWLSTAFNICGFGVSTYNMIQAVITKDVTSISWRSSLISTMNAIIWLCNGVLGKDVIMMTRNAIGVFVGASEIICYILCKKKGSEPTTNI